VAKFVRNAFRVLAVLWAGSLWSLALWVGWTLFQAQSDRHLAGLLAGRLISIETYLGLAVALVALLLPARTKFFWVYMGAALLAVDEWVLRSFMHSAQIHGSAFGLTFGAWHGVAALLYLLACLCVVVPVWREGF
jgi:hypothetical protein